MTTTEFKNEFDILYVNDGSKDKTLDEIKKISKKDKRVKYLSLSRNFGKESAMHAGLVNSKDKDFVIIDFELMIMLFQVPFFSLILSSLILLLFK